MTRARCRAAVDTGVANVAREGGDDFFDVVWSDGGFANHAAFVSTRSHSRRSEEVLALVIGTSPGVRVLQER